jgi:hypothetical protein
MVYTTCAGVTDTLIRELRSAYIRQGAENVSPN